MIICDTREKKWQHVRDWFEVNQIPYTVRKLDFGDYMIEHGDLISVDRKQNLDELAGNICSPDSGRFWREVRGAYKAGIQLVVLIEHGPKVKTIQDVLGWRSRYTKMTGQMLYEQMARVSYAYGVRFEFCDKAHTGERIKEILEGG